MATEHKVVKGDTLWGIAAKYLGSGSRYKELATLNGIKNPDLIYVGQIIKLTNDGGGSSSTTAPSNKPTIKQFGELSNVDNTLFATWEWGKHNTTASYKVVWTYDTGNGVWLSNNSQGTTITVDKDDPNLSLQHTYSIPKGAKAVRFKVKPVAETDKKDNREVPKWTAEWSETKTWYNDTPLTAPGKPTVKIEKDKLTASLTGVNIPEAVGITFEVYKDKTTRFASGNAKIGPTGNAAYAFVVDLGSEYEVHCRAYKEQKSGYWSDWSDWSDSTWTRPLPPTDITTIRAADETSVYLEWSEVKTATHYQVQYEEKKEDFDVTDSGGPSDIEFNRCKIEDLETGKEYFFRVRAFNESEDNGGASDWTDIKSVVVGTTPEPPTTWSSTTNAIVGEPVTLYWVHNSEDGSHQTSAVLELWVDGVYDSYTLTDKTYENSVIQYTPLSEDDLEDGKTHSCLLKTVSYVEGTKIEWAVKTAGITNVYSEPSTKRKIDVYAEPTLDLRVTDAAANDIYSLTAFPFYVSGVAGPKKQAPIGYHLEIAANEIYETTDNIGNPKTVNAGEAVYSKYFDTFESLLVEFTPGNIDLENGIEYTVKCVVSMDSGLTATATKIFTVNWEDRTYEPTAVITIDPDTLTASVRPYCENRETAYCRVNKSGSTYTVTSEELGFICGDPIKRAKTTTGEQVFMGTTVDGETVLYCTVEKVTPVTDIYLSVYRREFDGSFTELATGIDGEIDTTITDPHPALDFARYRIVATSKTTGAVDYYDPPGYLVGGIAVIIQWDEIWSSFETTEDGYREQPPWSGSLLKLPYNIDVSDSFEPEVEMINYIGRSHPVSYYGTQRGHTSTWAIAIEKDDKETLYGLRRLANWMGNVYVREPSGSGYWAHVTVSFEQQHVEKIIPVTLTITRVEGGI